MIRIRAGQSWKLNPAYQATLRALSPEQARRFGTAALLDALGVEVDGADVSRGHAEAAIVPAVDALCAVVLRLCREPSGRGQVALVEGRAELVLGRRGAQALLSLVSLARPARLLAGEIEVDLHALARAAAHCAVELASDLEGVNPALAGNPAVRRLRRQAAALQKAAQLGGPAAAEADTVPLRGRPAAPAARGVSLGFTLFDDEGRIGTYREGADLFSLLVRGEVALHAGGAGDAASATAIRLGDGPPFLVLTELVRGARELIAAAEDGDASWEAALGAPVAGALMRLDLRSGELRHGRDRLRAAPLPLARAFLEGALDFAGAVRARNPAQAGNAYLAALLETATERLAHLDEIEAGDLFADGSAGDSHGAAAARSPPGAPAEAPLTEAGRLSRMRYRCAFSSLDAGVRPRAVHLERGTGVVVAEKSVTFFDPATGAVRARRACDSAQLAPGADLVLATRAARLEGYGLQGAPRFLREGSGSPQPALTAVLGTLAVGAGGQRALACVLDGHVVAALLLETGRAVWQFEVPQAGRVFAVAGRERVYVAADNGAVYALDGASGRVAFRVRTGAAFATSLALGARLLAGVGRKDGALQLVALDAASGRPRVSREVAMLAAGGPLVARGLLLVGGVAQGCAAVAGFRRDGREQFHLTLPGGGGLPALCVHRERVFAAQRDGTLVCLGLDGEVAWAVPSRGHELERALPPLLRRGVLVVPGEPVRLFDPERGALLGELPAGRGLSALAVGRDLGLVAFDEDGVGSGYRLATHMAVVESR